MANPTIKQALYGPSKVGGDALNWCARCKLELAHVILSMVDGVPAKVQCKTCKSEHKFRKTPGTATKRAPAASKLKSRATKTVMLASELWEKRLAECSAKVGRPYAVTENFTKNDILEHSKFGVGVVEEVRSAGRINVLFRDGERLLVCAPAKPNA